MRHARRLALVLAGVLLAFASAAEAADGIKASATASRDVPADVLVVSFQIAERAVPAEGAADQQAILIKVLEENGLKVLERSARYLPGAIGGSYGGGQFNVISSTGGARDPVDVRKQVTFRVSGFKRLDDVLDILGRHGVRQQVSLIADHYGADAVRQDLQKEAIESAITQARKLAAHAGVKTGGVVDLATQPGYPAFFASPAHGYAGLSLPVVPAQGADQALVNLPRAGELPRLRFSVTANVVLGVKPD